MIPRVIGDLISAPQELLISLFYCIGTVLLSLFSRDISLSYNTAIGTFLSFHRCGNIVEKDHSRSQFRSFHKCYFWWSLKGSQSQKWT